MAEQRNDPSRKSKAEGDRWTDTISDAGPGDYRPDDRGTGITNRPLGEEIENQGALPPRGDSQHGAHAGHGDADDRRSER